MKRREVGTVNILTLWGGAVVATATGGHLNTIYASLRDAPADQRQVFALSICFLAGCISQLCFLLSHIGDDKTRPALRWLGEIALGGIAAYIVCVIFLRYGPEVELTQLIVVAVMAGFLGQRAIVLVIELGLKRLGIKNDPPPGGPG